MNVSNVMSTNIITLDMDDRLAIVKNHFEKGAFHHLVIVEDQTILGIISDRDLYKSISPNVGLSNESRRDSATITKKAHQIMSRNVKTITPETTVKEALKIMLDLKISCLPVIEKGGAEIKGMFSMKDGVRALLSM